MGAVVNTWDQIQRAGGGLFISRSRGGGWTVLRLDSKGREVVTDANAAWYNYKRKWFQHLDEAKAWCAERFGEHGPWSRNRLGDVLPTRVHKAFPLQSRPKTKSQTE